eukprot:TRINITY_DN109679_c0_g1_i1.p1 TRINITY_DN109679_c0_g1~~TRINITY_DN109679_c0_g1_i1.p1  ORF type:complete len:236 (-),score=42.47 TRINITY_DN109679_c0_g1_i1:14-721(-)
MMQSNQGGCQPRGFIGTTLHKVPGDATPEWGPQHSPVSPSDLDKKLRLLQPKSDSLEGFERSGGEEGLQSSLSTPRDGCFARSLDECQSGMATPRRLDTLETPRMSGMIGGDSHPVSVMNISPTFTTTDWTFVADGSTGWDEHEALVRETHNTTGASAAALTPCEEEIAEIANMDSGWPLRQYCNPGGDSMDVAHFARLARGYSPVQQSAPSSPGSGEEMMLLPSLPAEEGILTV